jgi:hypothetical protein
MPRLALRNLGAPNSSPTGSVANAGARIEPITEPLDRGLPKAQQWLEALFRSRLKRNLEAKPQSSESR